MRRLHSLALLCSALLACSSGESGGTNTFSPSEGDGETDSSGDGDSVGDGDGDSVGDGDGDSASGDGDGDTASGDGDGDTASGDGDGDTASGDGDGDTGELCERYRHTYDFDTQTWDSQPLDLLWTGPNAPPCSVEPLATTYLEPWDQLLVWADNGMYYRREGGTWQAPKPISEDWGLLANAPTIDSVTYTPPINGGTTCGLIFTARPDALLYNIYEDGGTSYDQTVALMNEPPPGAPQASSTRNWAGVLADPDLLGQAGWWTAWQGFDNGNVYTLDGAFVWSQWSANQSPIFAGAPPQVDPSQIEAGWGHFAQNRLHLIGR